MSGKDSYSLGAVKYWVHEFRAQRTDLQDEIRSERPLIDISAHIARPLNDKPFSSILHFGRQLAGTKEVVNRNLQEILGFHKCSLKWVPNVLSAEQKAARGKMSRELHNNLIFERQKILAQSSPGTGVGINGLVRNHRCWHDYAMMFQQGQFRKLIRKSRCWQYFPAARRFHSLILCQKARIWILPISATLSWKGSKPAPFLEREKRL
jgi:hypothetical protein